MKRDVDDRPSRAATTTNPILPSQSARSAALPPAGKAVALIVLLTVAAYANSFSGPFIFDDVQSIVENPTIHALWPPWAPLAAPGRSGITAGGRPVVNYTLAINYALSGFEVESYHLLNLALHLAAALTLFGILRRTFEQPLLRARFGSSAIPLATAATLLWALHPLQTESVTYVIQRAESLAGLFYFLTLYAFLRATVSPRPAVWSGLSILACALGVGAKEIVVTAPVMVLLYDRTFVAGTFLEALRRRRFYYLGLTCSWLLLAYLMSTTANRGNTMGFGMGVSGWNYFLTENRVIVHYLRLVFWPHPLCLDDYGLKPITSLRVVLLPFLLLTTLAFVTAWLVIRKTAAGVAGAWFFLILAPSSSFVPIADVLFEHRMYEPLAGLVALFVAAVYTWLGRRGFFVFGAIAGVFLALTFLRNEDYQTEKAIWTQTVAQIPNSARALNNLGNAFFHEGNFAPARFYYETALRADPRYLEANNNLAVVLAQTGHRREAVAQFRKTLTLAPFYPNALNNLAGLLMEEGRTEEALDDYARAASVSPYDASSRGNLARLLLQRGRREEAYTEFAAMLRVDPDNPEAHYHLGLLLAEDGRLADGIAHFQASLSKRPLEPQVLSDYGMALLRQHEPADASVQFAKAIALAPDYAVAHSNLGNALIQLHRLPEAEQEFDQAIRSDPRMVDAYNDSAVVLVQLGQKDKAIERLHIALQLNPHDLMAQSNLAVIDRPEKKKSTSR